MKAVSARHEYHLGLGGYDAGYRHGGSEDLPELSMSDGVVLENADGPEFSKRDFYLARGKLGGKNK